MRKIDKTKILSTEYKAWEEQFEQNNQNHPEYDSSKNKFYYDVVMNLLNVQGGLCAFTEMRLCSDELINENNWNKGKYSINKPGFKGQLDHFNPNLKKTKAWLWDNLFVIDTDINTKVKGKQDVDNILKLDTDSYDESELFEYDCKEHIFIANTELDKETQDRINEMIFKLGINYDPIIDLRKEYLSDKLSLKKFGLDYEINQFPTAFNICKIRINN